LRYSWSEFGLPPVVVVISDGGGTRWPARKKKVNFSAPHATILGDEASASATKRVPVKERITHGSLKKKSDRRAGFVL
jgi:hypothetical protein